MKRLNLTLGTVLLITICTLGITNVIILMLNTADTTIVVFGVLGIIAIGYVATTFLKIALWKPPETPKN